MTKEQALSLFASLVAKYGLQWGPSVPAKTYEEMARVSRLLTIDEKLQILNQATKRTKPQ